MARTYMSMLKMFRFNIGFIRRSWVALALGSLLGVAGMPEAAAQAYPAYWDASQYDLSQGDKGFLRVINKDGFYSPEVDKAVIFATTVLQKPGQRRYADMLRLTLAGVHTFASPFYPYPVTLNFWNQSDYQGGIKGNHDNLSVTGKQTLILGTSQNEKLVTVANAKTVFANNVEYWKDAEMEKLCFGLGASPGNKDFLYVGSTSPHPVMFGTNSSPSMILHPTNQTLFVGLSAADFNRVKSTTLGNQYSIIARDGILAEDFAIAPMSIWADFVFSPEYSLRSLEEVEGFINEEGHLPEVPSAAEVATEGYSQHRLNAVLLQKIEELTLYVIAQQKEIERLKAAVGQKQ